MYPLVIATQTVPIFAIAPLLIVWLGYGILSKVVMAALIVFFPIVVNTVDGLRAADPDAVNEIAGGHSEVTAGVDRTIVVTTALERTRRDRLLRSGGARVGDTLLLTKGAGIEGTASSRPPWKLNSGPRWGAI